MNLMDDLLEVFGVLESILQFVHWHQIDDKSAEIIRCDKNTLKLFFWWIISM